jgi:hypothetical protein
MDFKLLLDKIIKLDQHIRFALIFDSLGKIIEKDHRSGLTPILDGVETENMIREASSSWHLRKEYAPKLGKGQYTFTVYDNLNRITMPVDENHFILVSHDGVDDISQFVKNLQNTVESK